MIVDKQKSQLNFVLNISIASFGKYMKIYFQILFLFFMSIAFVNGQQPLSNRVANYDMEVYLDTDKKMTVTEMDFLWQNPSADTIRELQFHLYYNAFKNTESTFLKGANTDFGLTNGECNWGWSEVTKVIDPQGNNLTTNLEYIQTNDNNTNDQTVLKIPLAKPVLPFESLNLKINWKAKIPKLSIRTGYNREYYFMAQWFPKVGVYEGKDIRCADEGRWNCNQYHRATEYYSDFGVYEVSLNVPEGYVVGASGERITEQKEKNRKIYTYRAEDVIDFTWTAYPKFKEAKDKWKGVDIRLLYHPDRECVVERYLESAKYCFEYMHENVGAYPYSTLTIVDPPYHGIRSSGMEYPTLVTGAGFYCLPQDLRTTETITVHEMVHQYFMQMVASNEQEEAWLDEGFTSYYEGRIIDHYYDYIMESDWLEAGISNKSWRRYRYVTSDTKIGKAAQPGWEFRHGGYGPLTYGKTAVTLFTLEGLVGIETMDEIMQTYFERWKFEHPCGQNFIDVVSEIVRKNHGDKFGESMDWFFEETVYSSNECDYKLASIQNRKATKPLGFVENNQDCVEDETTEEEWYESKIIVHRLGEIKLPIELLVEFEDGKTELRTWDGKGRSEEFTFKHTSKVNAAILDPEFKIDLDINCVNNSLVLDAPKDGIWKYVSAWMLWVQNAMQNASFII